MPAGPLTAQFSSNTNTFIYGVLNEKVTNGCLEGRKTYFCNVKVRATIQTNRYGSSTVYFTLSWAGIAHFSLTKKRRHNQNHTAATSRFLAIKWNTLALQCRNYSLLTLWYDFNVWLANCSPHVGWFLVSTFRSIWLFWGLKVLKTSSNDRGFRLKQSTRLLLETDHYFSWQVHSVPQLRTVN